VTFRVLVTGSRRYANAEAMAGEIAQLPQDAVIVHGAATGADRLADGVAKARGLAREPHPADWEHCGPDCRPGHRRKRLDGGDFCPLAGPRRNQEMVDAGADLCLVFPGNRGTEDCARRAEKAGIRIKRIDH
jgi:hypothetical protein